MTKKDMRKIDIYNVLNNPDLDFSANSEFNLDLALSHAILYSLQKFHKSKRIKPRLLKSMTFLELTNDNQRDFIKRIKENYIDEKGKGRKEWYNIIALISKGLRSRDKINESKFSRLLR